MPSPPIRVERKGWRKVFHPTAKDLHDAVAWAAAEARHWRWENLPDLMNWIGTRVRDQLLVDVHVEIVAKNLEMEAAKVAVWTRHLPPDYFDIDQTLIGDKPSSAMEAGAQAIRAAVERVSEAVKTANPTNSITEPMLLTQRAGESHKPAQRDLPPTGRPEGATRQTPPVTRAGPARPTPQVSPKADLVKPTPMSSRLAAEQVKRADPTKRGTRT